jgi:hypothetical protein
VGVFPYGAPGWLPVAGDFGGTGRSGIAAVDPARGVWYIRFTPTSGFPDVQPFPYGAPNWRPLAGLWAGVRGAPQFADPAAPAGPAGVDVLTQEQLGAAVNAALALLQQDGVDPRTLGRLGSAQFLVANLPGRYLGLTQENTVRIDATAAGRGWSVDPAAAPAAGRMDLLTVVLHEMGHLQGRDDVPADGGDDLMADTLATGVRRTQALDAVFGSGL